MGGDSQRGSHDGGGSGSVRGESEGLPVLLRLLGVPGGKGPAGRILGRSSGREIEERAKIARAMKSKGFSAEEIAGITGLPIEEARQL